MQRENDLMNNNSIDSLGELQRAVMEVVWETGEASVHDVRAKLERRKKLAYTTVLTVMQKLEKAGWLDHRTQGNRYIYVPTRSRDEAGAGSVPDSSRASSTATPSPCSST